MARHSDRAIRRLTRAQTTHIAGSRASRGSSPTSRRYALLVYPLDPTGPGYAFFAAASDFDVCVAAFEAWDWWTVRIVPGEHDVARFGAAHSCVFGDARVQAGTVFNLAVAARLAFGGLNKL